MSPRRQLSDRTAGRQLWQLWNAFKWQLRSAKDNWEKALRSQKRTIGRNAAVNQSRLGNFVSFSIAIIPIGGLRECCEQWKRIGNRQSERATAIRMGNEKLLKVSLVQCMLLYLLSLSLVCALLCTIITIFILSHLLPWQRIRIW